MPTRSVSAPSAGVEKLTEAPGASPAPTSVKPPPVLAGAPGTPAIDAVPGAMAPRESTSALVPDRDSVRAAPAGELRVSPTAGAAAPALCSAPARREVEAGAGGAATPP